MFRQILQVASKRLHVKILRHCQFFSKSSESPRVVEDSCKCKDFVRDVFYGLRIKLSLNKKVKKIIERKINLKRKVPRVSVNNVIAKS